MLSLPGTAQNFRQQFDDFKNKNRKDYESFRREANSQYADFLRNVWEEYSAIAPVPKPKEPVPLPPVIYEETVIDENIKIDVPINQTPEPVVDVPPVVPDENEPVISVQPVTPIEPVVPVVIPAIVPEPQPLPVVPIKEQTVPGEKYWAFDFYGSREQVRFPEGNRISLASREGDEIADAWMQLSDGKYDNLVRDCLELRVVNAMCDWEYLQLLDHLAQSIYGDSDEATLLLAWLFSQSGYQMRLGLDDNKLYMLFGSKHIIYDRRSFNVDGTSFYPYADDISRLRIAQIEFPGETPLSLYIDNEPLSGRPLSDERTITARRYPGMKITSQVKTPLIEFFDTYPASAVGGNMMSRWAMYANTPLSKETKNLIYPAIKAEIDSLSQLDAAQRILNWIQTGLEYGDDDEIWGGDRAFFAEETLFYPYCDCEDRSILFSRLVRDLLGLDVALVYYPGHLATAVRFTDDVKGAKMHIDGAEFTVCDPTYIGAPVGKEMPGMNKSGIQAIVLNRN